MAYILWKTFSYVYILEWKLLFLIKHWSYFLEDSVDNKPVLVQVMAWCYKAKRQYLNQFHCKDSWCHTALLNYKHVLCLVQCLLLLCARATAKTVVKNSRLVYIDGLVQDCNNSSALAMELLQSCTKPSISQWYITVGKTCDCLV